MNLRQMEIFHAIMRTGSVTGAARLLNVTQPTVSTILRHCEDQLQFKLFDRIGGRLQPTPEAETIYPEVASLFDKVELVSGRIEEAVRSRSKSLSVVGNFAVANGPLATAAATFLARFPYVHLMIQTLPRPQVIDWIARRQADLGVAFAPVENAGVDIELLAEAHIPCILPPNHRLAALREIRIEHLEGEEIITYSPHTAIGGAVDHAFREAGYPLSNRVQVGYSLTAFAMAARGAGVALVEPSMLNTVGLPNLVARPLVPRIKVGTVLITPKGQAPSKYVKSFVEVVRTEVQGSWEPITATEFL